MIIPIDADYRISSDRYQWILQERREFKKGTEEEYARWENLAFYPRLEGIVEHLFDLKLRLSKTEGLEECIAEAKNLSAALQRALACTVKVDNIQGADLDNAA